MWYEWRTQTNNTKLFGPGNDDWNDRADCGDGDGDDDDDDDAKDVDASNDNDDGPLRCDYVCMRVCASRLASRTNDLHNMMYARFDNTQPCEGGSHIPTHTRKQPGAKQQM